MTQFEEEVDAVTQIAQYHLNFRLAAITSIHTPRSLETTSELENYRSNIIDLWGEPPKFPDDMEACVLIIIDELGETRYSRYRDNLHVLDSDSQLFNPLTLEHEGTVQRKDWVWVGNFETWSWVNWATFFFQAVSEYIKSIHETVLDGVFLRIVEVDSLYFSVDKLEDRPDEEETQMIHEALKARMNFNTSSNEVRSFLKDQISITKREAML